jgi:4-amino-4-deoxy-L-arabinose transferase-like glycosyltransferase
MKRQHWLRRLDAIWLFFLSVWAAAGMSITPFHGDESMHIYTSHDYATAFLQGRPDLLLVTPPYDIDSVPRLRLLNGSVMRYSIGLSWHLAGLSEEVLPPHPGWDWGRYYADNVATGHRPSDALLMAARTPAVLYLIGSVWILFGMGWTLGGRWTAYLASAIYILNPIILLNGRRALVESALLCFGLLTVWIALEMARRRDQHARITLAWWVSLTVAAALTLASKYSGTIFVAGAYGGLLLAEAARMWSLSTFRSAAPRFIGWVLGLGVSGIAALALLAALSPALWNDPPARVRELAMVLQEQVDIVVSILPDAPTPLSQRIEGILTQPFIAPTAYFEQASWGEAQPVLDEIARYEASPLSGLHAGGFLGGLLTVLAGIGLILTGLQLRQASGKATAWVILAWLLVTVANLLINPLPWQRYYLPLIPAAALLAAAGAYRTAQAAYSRIRA